MSTRSISVCVAALVFSCGGKKKDEEPAEGTRATAAEHQSADPQATVGSTLGSKAGSSAMAARKLAAEENRKQLLAALDGWVQAQNTQDFDAYCSFYQTKGFQGIRRTSDKKSKKFDFDGWKRDRARMFKLKQKVAAEQPEVMSWLDPGAKLKVGISEIRFMQRWQGGRYADHGIKVLRFARNPAGKQHIIYEDLLNSEPGWERKAADDVETLSWEVPSDSAAALARWRELGVTGANYQDKLAALPEDKAFRRKMAVALFEGGNFDCDAFVGEGDCGMLIEADEMEINFLDDDRLEWAPLDPKAGFENPCLRRRLAIWAADYLEPADAKPLRKQVLALAALGAPEKELIDIAFRLARGVGEDLLLEALAACRRVDDLELADDHLRELSENGLLHAATVLEIDMAAALLPAKKFHAAIGKLLVDDKIGIEVRRDLAKELADLPDKDVTEALIAATADADCELAMIAATALAARGTTDYLPKRPDSKKIADYARTLCLLAHDEDESRQTAVLRDLVGKGKKLSMSYEYSSDYEDEDEGEYEDEDDSAEEDEEEEEEEPDKVYEGDAIAAELLATDPSFGSSPFFLVGTSSVSCDEKNLICHAGPEEDRATFEFARAEDGTLYLTSVGSSYYQPYGC